MRNLMQKLWNDDRGAVLATEWLFVSTILVIGLTVGLKAVQQSVLSELEDLAGAIGALSQSYSFAGTSGCAGNTNGSSFHDTAHWPSVTTNAQEGSLNGDASPGCVD